MDNNDFLGSFAQENVAFSTQVVKTAVVGDNFFKTMIFVENDRFVNSSAVGWVTVPGVANAKAVSVNADTYLSFMEEPGEGVNILQGWLSDLFVNGNTYDCILVACGASSGTDAVSTFTSNMQDAYDALKAYAYHKTVCACPSDSATVMTAVLPSLAVALAQRCKTDKGLLSSAPYLPYTTTTPEDTSSDPLYAALTGAQADAFMSAYQDPSRNTALYSLGIALSILNGSGTPVGNSMDMIATSNIQSSGPSGQGLSPAVRSILTSANIQSFKPVGNNTGSCAAMGAKTLQGDVIQATWIVAYVTYMTKVGVAQLLTQANFMKNAANYTQILAVLKTQLGKFGESGSGRLSGLAITAPGFGSLPEAKGDEIIIPNAWSANYVDQVRKVQITGTLYISA